MVKARIGNLDVDINKSDIEAFINASSSEDNSNISGLSENINSMIQHPSLPSRDATHQKTGSIPKMKAIKKALE